MNMYKTIVDDPFPDSLVVQFNRFVWDPGQEKLVVSPTEMRLAKTKWNVAGESKGLRYGENPGQPAALYHPAENNIQLDGINLVQDGALASRAKLLQSGKHPGKTNITDVDNAINILRYFDEPTCSIMKHNNPCGVAIADNTLNAYIKANNSDRVAAFGGAIVFNKAVDKETAEAIIQNYSEVVSAPEFEEGVMDIFSKRKNLRVMQVPGDYSEYRGVQTLEFKTLMDGGIIVQASYVPNATTLDDFRQLPLGYGKKDGIEYRIQREPTESELKDMRFGWLVESGVTSNSVIYVKDGQTIGIGTGEQDRVGVAQIAKDKAYTKTADLACFNETGKSYNEMLERAYDGDDQAEEILEGIDKQVARQGLEGVVMVSDAFFPKPDGVLVGLRDGVGAVIQPGGSIADADVVNACNDYDATMLYTEQRSFKH